MGAVTNATPLMALDAVVIDTETTGLDPSKSFIVEIGAVKIVGGRVDADQTFRRLLRPPVPIPPQSSAIHGIDDGMVADAPDFSTVWRDFSDFAGDAVVVGHTLGFDFSIMQRECARSGIAWKRPKALDTQLLMLVAEPNFGGLSLEQLANWLGVEITDRHSALGDAITTAHIFNALVPHLRVKGIRTLAEAMQACRALTDVLDKQHRAGWSEVADAPAPEQPVRSLDRFDSYPYRHRNRDVMSAPPKIVAADRTLSVALSRMIGEKISSLFVCPLGHEGQALAAADAGIITERDVLRALAIEGSDALQLPIDQFMSRPLAVVLGDDFVYRAIGRMQRLKIRHLGVVDNVGIVVGALSARDLLRLRASEAISLGDEINQAADVHQLGKAWAKLPQVASSLLSEGVPAPDIAAVISRELGALTRQAAVLAEQRMREDGCGEPPCAYSMAVLGSAGRGESLLAMDQDNALIFEHGEPDGPEDRWFAEFAVHVADYLHQVGVPYCKGGVMAKNPQWRGSLATWRARVADWIGRSNPADLMAVDIFFDLRGVHGANALAETLWRDGFEAAKGRAVFAKLLAEAAGEVEPGFNFLGGIRTEQGRIDLKKAGLFGIVTAARVLAIRHHVLERATPRRLAGIMALDLGGEQDLAALAEAQMIFLSLILDQQIDDIEHGRPATNTVVVKRLSPAERDLLQRALRAVRHLGELTRDLLFKD
jgi:DNA polymerase-3 subunit epsilon/CBS domain-containing protein